MHAKGQYFRAGVGALIMNERLDVLAFERSDIPGAWQMPQGGIEADEEPSDAIWREITEETGLSSSDLSLLGQYPDLLAYELPPDARSEKTGRGQVQYWFLLKCKDTGARAVVLNEEFRSWQWMPLEELVEKTVEFRRSVYKKLLAFVESSNFVSDS